MHHLGPTGTTTQVPASLDVPRRSARPREPHLRLGQLLPQLIHLLAEVPDDPRVGVLVDHSVVHDVLGAVRVPQGGEGLVIVVRRGAHSGHHGSLAVSPKAVLEGERLNGFFKLQESIIWER